MNLTPIVLISCLALVACGRSAPASPSPAAQLHSQSIFMPPPAPSGESVRPDTYLVTLRDGIVDSEGLRNLFREQGFEITDVMEPRPDAPGPCGRVAYGLTDRWGRAPEGILAGLADQQNVVFGVDPLTGGVVGGVNEASRLLPDPTDDPSLPWPPPPHPLPSPAGYVDHLSAIGAGTAHARGHTGQGVTIAVLDTGVSPHASLAGKSGWTDGVSFTGDDIQDNLTDHLDAEVTGGVSDGHGTGVAELAVGLPVAGTATGVAPGASLLDVRVCDRFGRCRGIDVLKGVCHTLETLTDPAELPNHLSLSRLVLNLSFGGSQDSGAVRDALRYAISEGALVVAAGGNEGAAGLPEVLRNRAHFPAASQGESMDDGLVAVGALKMIPETGRWQHADFSTAGRYIDIAAPGADLRTASALDRGVYSARTGTSFAAPLVSGALAILRQAHPTWPSAQIEAALKAAALPLAGESWETVGAGMLNLSDAAF